MPSLSRPILRRTVLALPAVLLALSLAGGLSAPAAQARGKGAAPPPEQLPAGDTTVDPAMAGRWLPYSADAYYQLGPLELKPGTLRFDKGQNFAFVRDAGLFQLAAEKGANQRAIEALCSGRPARSARIGLEQKNGKTMLQIAFFANREGTVTADAAPGPGVKEERGANSRPRGRPGPGALPAPTAKVGPDGCQTIVYTRAEPLVL